MNHLTHIWQLVVRHEQLFYASRYAFPANPVNMPTFEKHHASESASW